MRTDRRALARALVVDWDAGAERVWYGQLPDDAGDTAELATALEELDRSAWDRHGRLLRAALLFDPALPPTFRGTSIAAPQLAQLAADAVRQGAGSPAFEVLASLRDQEVLAAVGQLTGATWAERLARDWATARDEVAALLAAHGDGSARLAGDLRTLGDAWLLELLVDPDARSRVRTQLSGVEGGQRLPAWFRAARAADASASAMLAASLLIPQVRRDLEAEAAGVGPAAPDERVTASKPSRVDDRDREDADRLLARSVAIAAAVVVAAAALRWPIVTSVAVLVWLVVDRVVSFVADPFLRLVGGWPPRIRGWALAWLPLRVVGLVLRAPWRLLGDLLLLAFSVLLADRLLAAGHLAAGWIVADGIDISRAELVARWFAPVWCGVAVWVATRRWSGDPPMRGAALLAGSLRRTPMAVRASFLAVSVLLVVIAAQSPPPTPWSPYDDHREAIAAVLGIDDVLDRFTVSGEAWLPDTSEPPLFGDGSSSDDEAANGPALEAPQWQVVDATALNVRAGPGADHPVVARLSGGTIVAGLGPVEDVDGASWVQLRLDDGTVGWASGRYLDVAAG